MWQRVWAAAVTVFVFGAAEPALLPVRVERDVVYRKIDNRELRLDLAMPRTPVGRYPAVVCLHGGAWRGGSRTHLSQTNLLFPDASLIEQLAARGFVVVSVGYRLAPGTKFPGPLHDAQCAIRWVRTNADKFAIDPKRVAISGVSAGGHLACLAGLALPCDGLDCACEADAPSCRVQAVVSLFGPTNLWFKTWSAAAEDSVYRPLLGVSFAERPEIYRKASPVDYVHEGSPPFLFLHGTADPVVDPGQTHQLADLLSAAGTKVRVIEERGEAHGWGGAKATKSIGQMAQFLHEAMGK